MYSVSVAAAESWRELLAHVARHARQPVQVIDYPAPAPLPELWARPDKAAVFMCGLPYSRAEPRPHLLAAPVPAASEFGGQPIYWSEFVVRAEGPGLVRVAGRIRTRISVFGEHVEGFELAQALAAACSATDAEVAHYHVAPVLPTHGEPRGAHQWLVAFTRPPRDAQAFISALDGYLVAHVLDYAAHRRGDGQLLAPRLSILPSGAFTAYLAASGRCDAQRKMPQAWPDRTIADQLLAQETCL